MGTRSDSEAVHGAFTRPTLFLVRSFIVILGAVGILWGAGVAPVFFREYSIERIANHIIAGEQFKTETLTQQLPIVEAAEHSLYCRSSALRSATLIRFGIVGNIISSNNKSGLDENMNLLRSSVRISLSCSPSDAVLWLLYYWVQTTQAGDAAEQLKYLRMSYRLGPNEAWIGLVRNRLALAIFEQLPPDLAKSAINEFFGLLETGRLYRQVAEIYIGLTRHVRQVLLPRLSAVSDKQRDAFIYELRRLGYDVYPQGTDKHNRRPWR